MVQLGLKVWEEPMFQFEAEGKKKQKSQTTTRQNNVLAQKQVRQIEFPFTQGRVSLLVLFKSSTDWVRPTNFGRAICFTQSVSLNVNCMHNHPQRHRIIFDQMSW